MAEQEIPIAPERPYVSVLADTVQEEMRGELADRGMTVVGVVAAEMLRPFAEEIAQKRADGELVQRARALAELRRAQPEAPPHPRPGQHWFVRERGGRQPFCRFCGKHAHVAERCCPGWP